MIKPIPTHTPLRSRAVAWLSRLGDNLITGAGMLHDVMTGGLL